MKKYSFHSKEGIEELTAEEAKAKYPAFKKPVYITDLIELLKSKGVISEDEI